MTKESDRRQGPADVAKYVFVQSLFNYVRTMKFEANHAAAKRLAYPRRTAEQLHEAAKDRIEKQRKDALNGDVLVQELGKLQNEEIPIGKRAFRANQIAVLKIDIAVAYATQAIQAAEEGDELGGWRFAVQAAFFSGSALALTHDELQMRRRKAPAIDGANKEWRAIKASYKAWFQANRGNYKSVNAAAEDAIKKKIDLASEKTIKNYFYEFEKEHKLTLS